MQDEYVLTSSMQARAIVSQGRRALIAMARDEFRSAVRILYQGMLEKARLGDTEPLHQHKDTADERIVQSSLDVTYSGWRHLSLAITGDRMVGWNDMLGLHTRDCLYTFVRGFQAGLPELRVRYQAVLAGATDDIIDAAVKAHDENIPMEYVRQVIDSEFWPR